MVSGVSSSYYFFFQAEDGIRDLTVTGVQTCALPISHRSRRGLALAPAGDRPCAGAALRNRRPHRGRQVAQRSLRGRRRPRSEERRVGKECRSRWWPYQSKKKSVDILDLSGGTELVRE